MDDASHSDTQLGQAETAQRDTVEEATDRSPLADTAPAENETAAADVERRDTVPRRPSNLAYALTEPVPGAQVPGGSPDVAFAPTKPVPGAAMRAGQPQGSQSARASIDDLPAGSTVNRYLIVERLGRGGLGVVYAAYDPVMDRKVALKFLRARFARQRETLQKRLLREAQAVARVSHPNIVAAYDTGMFRSHVYIAMEYVNGQTLTEWVAEDRPWREVVAMYIGAGRGLAAAHDRGIVHRDFKPDNVMIGVDGRARVLDFGIAASSRDGQGADEPGAGESGSLAIQPGESGSLAIQPGESVGEADRLAGATERLTQVGTIMGTPAYMAPEQHAGLATDARTDQYAFCVALYEGLYGRRPFDDGERVSLDELHRRKRAEEVAERPADSRVSAHLERSIVRGLAPEPAERWPSMNALLAELARDPGVWRDRIIAGLGALAVVAAVAFLIWPRDRQPVVCHDGAERVAKVWGPELKDRAHAGFLAAAGERGEPLWARLESRLEGYVTDWQAGYVNACEATLVRKTQSTDLLDRRMACLTTRLSAFHTLAELLVAADAELVGRALATAGSLPGIAECADTEALLRDVALPADPEVRARVEELGNRLARADVIAQSGRDEEAFAMIEEIAAEGETLDYLPLRASALYRLGRLTRYLGNRAEAVRLLDEAFFAAEASGSDALEVRIATSLVDLTGDDALRRSFERRAEAAIIRSGRDDLRAELLSVQAGHKIRQGDPQAALGLWQKALAITVESGTANVSRLAARYNNVGVAHGTLGDYEKAIEFQGKARDLLVAEYGELHVRAGMFSKNVGGHLVSLGRLGEAERELRRALKQVAPGGSTHRTLAYVRSDMAWVLERRGKLTEARDSAASALAMWERLGLERLQRPLRRLAMAHLALGEHETAVRHLRRAVEYRASRATYRHELLDLRVALARALRRACDLEASGAELELARVGLADKEWHQVDTASELFEELGHLELARGRHEQAREHYQRAVALLVERAGPDNPWQFESLVGLARCAMAASRWAEAETSLERAIAMMRAMELDGRKRADAEFLLARVRDARGQADDATALADQARASLAEIDSAEPVPWVTERAREIDAWLQSR